MGRVYYVVATARAGGMVAHWRQGPFMGADATVTFELELPQELPGLLATLGAASLSAVVVTTTYDDVPIGQSRLGWTRIALEEGRVVGAVAASEFNLTTGGLQ